MMSRYTQFRVPTSLIQETCQAETIKMLTFTNNQESYPKLVMSKGKSTEATHSTSNQRSRIASKISQTSAIRDNENTRINLPRQFI